MHFCKLILMSRNPILVVVLCILFIGATIYLFYRLSCSIPSAGKLVIEYPNSWTIEIVQESWGLVRGLLISLLWIVCAIIIYAVSYAVYTILRWDHDARRYVARKDLHKPTKRIPEIHRPTSKEGHILLKKWSNQTGSSPFHKELLLQNIQIKTSKT